MSGIEVVECALSKNNSPGYIRVKCSCDCIIKIKEGDSIDCPNCNNKFEYNGVLKA